MKIFMTGGTGFVRTYLSKQLVTQGHKVTILSPPPGLDIGGIRYIDGNPTIRGHWQKIMPEHDVIINLEEMPDAPWPLLPV